MTPKQIGTLIRATRKLQGLRQDELAAASGVGRQSNGPAWQNAGRSRRAWLRDRHHATVGALAINKQGDTSFSYAETWLAKPAAGAISLSLPLRAGIAGLLSASALIGNADAHAKNYSPLYRDDAIEMAPLYNLLATVAYPDLSPKLAMKIAGRTTLDALKARDWGRFADESGVSQAFVKRRAKALADRVLRATEQIEAGFNLSGRALKKMNEYANLTAERAAKLSRITG